MTAEQYAHLTAPFRGGRAQLVPMTDRAVTTLGFAAYPAILFFLRWKTGALPWREIAVPAASLVLVSLLRALLDRPRPYERLAITPLIAKSTRGRSFPSRHVFSVFIIAATGFTVAPWVGAAMTAAGVLLMATRVLGGVHDLWDVLAGAALGLLLGAAGYMTL